MGEDGVPMDGSARSTDGWVRTECHDDRRTGEDGVP